MVRVHDVAVALDLDPVLVIELSRLGFLPKDERGSYDLEACRARMAYLRERMVEETSRRRDAVEWMR